VPEYHPFEVKVDGRDIELTPENHGIALFRFEPEYDYIDITEPIGPDEEELKHTLIFRHRWLCLWMGRIVLSQEDKKLLEEVEEEHELFFMRTGWLSKVLIEDRPSEFEREMFTQSLMADLNRAEHLPEEWNE
jgi:hypothetical protein